MNSINIKKWKNFLLTELFDITGSTTTPKQKLNLSDNAQFPYVTTAGTNNGICGYSNVYTEIGNVLTVDSAVLGTVFYQKDNFTASDHVEKLIPKFNLTENIANFIVTVLNNSAKTLGYAYNEKRSQQALKSEQIKLPVNVNGEPDWEYLESYMKNIMQESEKNIENLININSDKHIIESTKWKSFIFGQLFEMQKQKEISPIYAYNKDTHKEIKYPFYGQSSENNGIISFISLENGELLNNKDGKPIIMIHSNNHLSFYVDTPFYLKDGHGATSLFTNKNLNKYNVFFVIAVLNKTMEDKFDYSLKATKEKLNSLIIKLPVRSNEEPDWEYMENYMKNIMQDTQSKLDKLVCC